MGEGLVFAELGKLRRYAYCLLGNRQMGDRVVESALNHFASDNLKGFSGSRLDLYKKVNETSSVSPDNLSVMATGSLARRFFNLTRPQRQIVALRAIVRLSYPEISAIMNISEKTVRCSYRETLLLLREKPAVPIENESFIALDWR